MTLRYRVTRLVQLARPDLLDGLRGRRQLVVRGVTPIVMLVLLAGVMLVVGGGSGTGVRDGAYEVGVEGDLAGASATLERLEDAQLQLIGVDDAALAVLDGMDVGLVVPDGLDAKLAEGQSAELVIEESPLRRSSRAAALLLASSVSSLHYDEVLSPGPGETAARERLVSVEVTTIELVVEGVAVLVAQLVPGLLCLQAALLTNGTASRLAGRSGMGLLQSQLTLPVRRSELAAAKSLAELAVGTVVSVPVLAVVLVLSYLQSLDELGGAGLAVALVAVLASLVALGALASATGALIGLASRSHQEVALGTGIVLAVAAITAGLVALGPSALPPPVAVVPVAGLVSALRNLLEGSAGVGWVVVALASTSVTTAAMVRLAARALNSQQMVMRW